MQPPPTCPPSDALEELALGHPAPADVAEHVAGCEACQRRVQILQDENALLGEFLDAGAHAAEPTDGPHELDISGYDVLREVHRGGQGVVYHAIQRSTGRDVAIKVMRQGPFATLADRSRFEREIETLAGLRHPNIVAVHDAGVSAGFHYFVMDYVDGSPLDQFLAAGADADRKMQPAGSVDPAPASGVPGLKSGIQDPESKIEAVVRLFVTICDAVHAAHLRGVIHRDLKPSNIRVDRTGRPFVLDFGLAKSVDAERDSAMTRTGQFVGSLPWASPEQVEGSPHKVDLRTDVYSLGAILYQLLAGAPPFDVGSNLRDALDGILTRDAQRPSAAGTALSAGVSDELDTIVLKCLAKDRERRYQSAGELAADLRRYLAGQPIDAKRDSALYVLRKTIRRYRLRFAAAFTLVLTLVAVSIIMTMLYRQSLRLEHRASGYAASLADALAQSNIENGRMAGVVGDLDRAERLLWRQLLLRREPDAHEPAAFHDPPGPPEAYWALRELYQRRPCRRTLARDRAAIATLLPNGDVCLGEFGGDASTYSPERRSASTRHFPAMPRMAVPIVSPDGSSVFAYENGELSVWNTAAPDEVQLRTQVSVGPDGGGLSCSRDARRFAAIVDGVAVVYDLGDLAAPVARVADDGALAAVALDAIGARLATRDRSGVIRVHAVDTGAVLATLGQATTGEPATLGVMLFSRDGRRLVDLCVAIPGRVWDLTDSSAAPVELSERAGVYRVVDFDPSGARIAVGDLGGMLRLFDARSGERLDAFTAHTARIRSVAFTADGARLWSCADDSLRLWDVGPRSDVVAASFGTQSVNAVELDADGTLLLGGAGRELCRYAPDTLTPIEPLHPAEATIAAIARSENGSRLAVATYDPTAWLWADRAAGRAPIRLSHPRNVSHAVFTPGGATLVTASDDGSVRLWNAADGTLERDVPLTSRRIPCVAMHPDGTRIVAAVRDGSLVECRLDDGALRVWQAADGNPLRVACFSPDGHWLIAAGARRVVQLFDARTRTCVAELAGHGQEIFAADISRCGQFLATGDAGGMIRLWHLALQRPLAALEGHTAGVMSLRFSSDAGTLYSASLDATVRRWNLRAYDEHIRGQVDAQLRRQAPALLESQGAKAWRDWASQTTR